MPRRHSAVLRTRLAALVRVALAPYLVLDDYGTARRCWTLAEARSWLPYCSERCAVYRLLPVAVRVG